MKKALELIPSTNSPISFSFSPFYFELLTFTVKTTLTESIGLKGVRTEVTPLIEWFCTLFGKDWEELTGDDEEAGVTGELKLKIGSEELLIGREICGNTGTSTS